MDSCKRYKRLIIFGAQGYALAAYEAIKTLYPEYEIPFFMVSSPDGNAPVLGGIPVKEISEVSSAMSETEKQSIEVLIATPPAVHQEIESLLVSHSFLNNKRLDDDLLERLLEKFHEIKGRFKPLQSLPMGDDLAEMCIYMARCHKDRPYKNSFLLPENTYPIQVGRSCCDKKIADITDDTGDNISKKNGNYSELTGLYWIWKNALCKGVSPCGEEIDYFGLVQYRRMFDLSLDDETRITGNDVDVVLPYPLPYEPDINAHHLRYLKDADWNALLAALKELQPEYAAAFPDILGQRYLYNYNVIIAKKQVLSDYCSWLFPILERTEELSDPKGCDRSDRYIGYMGETLETLYFMKNADHLKITHTCCRMVV